MPRISAYEVLAEPVDIARVEGFSAETNRNYDKYLRMQKVLVGQRGAQQLEQMYLGLKDEIQPAYLAAAGSAAIEAALVRSDKPMHERLGLLNGAAECLTDAIRNQKAFDALEIEPHKDTVMAERVALELATLPLLEGIVFGAVRPPTTKSVFEDCLNVAQANVVSMNLAKREGAEQKFGEHIGFAYECNALLSFNRKLYNTLFMVPALARADSGYYWRQQTHDMLIVQQDWGDIKRMTPVEIKASASRRDRERYKALLVRGKMHLSVEGKCRPEDTLAALSATYEGTASPVQEHDTEVITEVMTGMMRDYWAGDNLDEVATPRSRVQFRDNSVVTSNYAGLVVKVA